MSKRRNTASLWMLVLVGCSATTTTTITTTDPAPTPHRPKATARLDMVPGFWNIFQRICSINWAVDFPYVIFVICVGSILIIEFGSRLPN